MFDKNKNVYNSLMLSQAEIHNRSMRKILNICVLAQLDTQTIEWMNTNHKISFWNQPKVSPEDAFFENADVVILRSPYKLNACNLKACKKLKAIIRAGSGIDNLSSDILNSNIPIHTTPVTTDSVAEHAIGLLLAAARQTVDMHFSLRSGEWKKAESRGIEIFNTSAMVVGFGRVGRRVSEILSVLCKNLLVCDPTLHKPEKEEKLSQLSNAQIVNLIEGIKRSNIIVFCCPSNTDSSPILTNEMLSHVNDNTIIVNVGRGSLIDEFSLIKHLKQGRIRVGLDTFQGEPSIPERLLNCPNVVITPHIGAQTSEARRRVGQCVQEIVEEIAYELQ